MAEQRSPERIWSSRKFTSAWGLTIILVVLLWYSKLDAAAFGSALSIIWLGYFAGNVGDKYVRSRE